MPRQDMRTPLARATGLGSAGKGLGHWWAERISAVALVPLTLWFVAETIAHVGGGYGAFTAWMKSPMTAVLMILLLVALFHHTALGLQVVIEDYIHSSVRFAAVTVARLGSYALAAAGILATLKIAFGR